jgi:hypothetical protein
VQYTASITGLPAIGGASILAKTRPGPVHRAGHWSPLQTGAKANDSRQPHRPDPHYRPGPGCGYRSLIVGVTEGCEIARRDPDISQIL